MLLARPKLERVEVDDPIPAPVLRVEEAREDADCTIAALAMYLGQRYEDILRMVALVDRDQGRKGLHDGTIRAVAKHFGIPLRLKKQFDVEDDYGLLRFEDHCAVLRNGLVIDVDRTVWEFDDFIKAKHAQVLGLFIATRKS